MPQVLEELTVSGGTTNLAKAYTYGLDLISQRAPNTSTNFFGYDGLGSVRFLVNGSGTITDTYAYDAYGTLFASNGTTPNVYLNTGEQPLGCPSAKFMWPTLQASQVTGSIKMSHERLEH